MRRVYALTAAVTLTVAACLPAPRHAHGGEWTRGEAPSLRLGPFPARLVWVTGYDLWGPTYEGGWAHPAGPGIAAASWDVPAGAVVWVAGARFEIWDRGGGLGFGNPTWLDLWGREDLTGWQWAEVEP
jgi:hypothetical protein